MFQPARNANPISRAYTVRQRIHIMVRLEAVVLLANESVDLLLCNEIPGESEKNYVESSMLHILKFFQGKCVIILTSVASRAENGKFPK